MLDSGNAAGDLRVHTTWMPDCRIVTAAGRVTGTNTHHLHYALSQALHPEHPLIADLTQVTAMDAAGPRALLLNQRNAELQGARLLLVPSIAVALAVGAEGALTLCPDLADALIAARHPAIAAHPRPHPAAAG